MKKLILSILLAIYLIGGFSHTAGASKEVKVWYMFDQSWWNWWYKDNCSTWNIRPTNHLILGAAYNTSATRGVRTTLKVLNKAVKEARDLGFVVIPEFTLRFQDGFSKGKEYQAWFSRKVWAEQAKYIKALAVTMDDTKRFVIDIEPYWKTSPSNPRYIASKDAYKFAAAVVPFVDAVKAAGIKELWILPGRLIYEHIKVLAAFGLNMKVLDEGTYTLPDLFHTDKPEYEKRMKVSLNMDAAHSVAGIDYLPGFYETALKHPGFVDELRSKGIREAWVFPRRGGHFDADKNKGTDISRHHKFCTPEWFNIKLTPELIVRSC